MTRISFCLHDPSHYFKSASFVYNWDFGDGVYQITKEPFVYYNCSAMGNRTVHLKVVAEWEQTGSIVHERETVQKTGDFTTALELLDAVKSINVVGSRETHVMENLSLSLHINGIRLTGSDGLSGHQHHCFGSVPPDRPQCGRAEIRLMVPNLAKVAINPREQTEGHGVSDTKDRPKKIPNFPLRKTEQMSFRRTLALTLFLKRTKGGKGGK
ncbi:transhypothetical protein [Limosa lapponica baueri]|uniref:PKD domain-containing protein n=1 Tax=Limosa lapponica baueri TaxID=1758121 RepID=A0A2I0TRX0_LIMLA|nr:transhypothetical protein [Limosa lapponica baueri]